jgi:hypothetical protein
MGIWLTGMSAGLMGNFLAHDIRHCYMFLSTWNIALRDEDE